jgi:hypothetical protein
MHQSKKRRIDLRIKWILIFALRREKPKEIAPSRFGRRKFSIYLPKSAGDLDRHSRHFRPGYSRRGLRVKRIGSSRKNGASIPIRALTRDPGAARFA